MPCTRSYTVRGTIMQAPMTQSVPWGLKAVQALISCPAQVRGFEACQGCEPFPRYMPHGGEFAGYPLVFSVVTDYLGAGEHLRIGGERREH